MDHSEQLERQQQAQQAQQNLSQAHANAPSYSDRKEYLEAVIQDDLDPATIEMLRNMTSRDFILSNLSDAEINEIKHLREITLKKIYASHPHPDAAMQGELRRQVYRDGKPLRALSQYQKILIDDYIRAAHARVARSRDGFQQEQFGKTISASEIRNEKDSNDGGIFNW